MLKTILSYSALVVILVGCSSRMSPREVTIEFVGAVIEDDSLSIERHLDLDSMVKHRLMEIPPVDSTETPEYLRNRILQNLIGDGGTRALWKSMIPVVNRELIVGDTAEVELTFLDKANAKYHYSKIYLHKTETGWRVFYFL